MGFLKDTRPENGRWRVIRRDEDQFQVRRPDGSIFGTYPLLSQAAGIAGRRQKEDDMAASRRERPCMCCRRFFESDGIHNRLCDICRRHGGEWAPYGVASGSRGGRKPAR